MKITKERLLQKKKKNIDEKKVNHLFFHFNFNFFTCCLVVLVSFELDNSLIGAFFLQVLDLKGSLTFLVGGCLIGFALNFQSNLNLFKECLAGF